MRRIERAEREEREFDMLAPEATKATESRGRAVTEAPDRFRTIFERDRDRIVHSKAFRRLKHKTQVFLNPEGDHYVTRLTHTVHVTQVGRAMATGLGLNEALTEAICIGHDVGHSPFGHTGEDALTPYVDGEWLHSEQGVRVLSILEPLNLSWEVLDGIRAHSWKIDPPPTTPEGYLCRFADRIAYLTHDVSDAIRADVIMFSDLPLPAVRRFGDSSRQWIGSMIEAVIDASATAGHVTMDTETLEIMHDLRDFMFERVYLRPDADPQKDRAIQIIGDLVEWFRHHPEDVPDSYRTEGSSDLVNAIDYVSGMTDRFAIMTHDALFRPTLFS